MLQAQRRCWVEEMHQGGSGLLGQVFAKSCPAGWRTAVFGTLAWLLLAVRMLWCSRQAAFAQLAAACPAAPARRCCAASGGGRRQQRSGSWTGCSLT